MKSALTAIAALVLTATAAQAQWTGCRVGAGASILASVTDLSGGDTAGLGIAGNLESLGTQGAYATGLVGCDVAIGPVILGALADYSFGENEFKANVVGFGATADLKTGFENPWAVGVRAGYTVTPTTAVFLTGGYTGAKSNDIVATLNGAEIARYKLDDLKGYFIGTQIETMITPRLAFTLGYRFTRFDGQTVVLAPLPAALNLDNDVHAVTATISFKFGGSDTTLLPTK